MRATSWPVRGEPAYAPDSLPKPLDCTVCGTVMSYDWDAQIHPVQDIEKLRAHLEGHALTELEGVLQVGFFIVHTLPAVVAVGRRSTPGARSGIHPGGRIQDSRSVRIEMAIRIYQEW
jgi:hypothetical protein